MMRGRQKEGRGAAAPGVIWWLGPQGGQWWPRAPRGSDEPVRVVADVIEESIAHIDVPAGLIGATRAAYIRTQLDFALPGVSLRAIWPSPVIHWPRAGRLVVFGLDSPVVQQGVEALLAEERPVSGVWTITQRLLRAARRATGDRLLALPTPHGLRLLLLVAGEARFTRLIVGLDAQQWQAEVMATVRYARDQRWVARDRALTLDWFGDAAQAPALLEPDVIVQVQAPPGGVGEPWWAWLLARTRATTPGQLAPAWFRRYAMLQQARRLTVGLGVLAVLTGAGAAAWATVEAWEREQERDLVMQQVVRRQNDTEVQRRQIAESGVRVEALRSVLQIREAAPPPALSAPNVSWRTAQWLAAAPGMRLRGVQWQPAASPCASAESAVATAPASTPNAATSWELRLDVDAGELVDLGQREAAVRRLTDTLRRASPWRLELDPLQTRANRVLGSQSDRLSDAVQWCLSWTADRASPEGRP